MASSYFSRALLLVVCLVGIQTCRAKQFEAARCRFALKRLPTHIRPERYQVVLDPQHQIKKLYGKVRIHLNVVDPAVNPFPPDTKIPDEIHVPNWNLDAPKVSQSVETSKTLPPKKRRLSKRAAGSEGGESSKGESSRQAGKRPYPGDAGEMRPIVRSNQIILKGMQKMVYSELSFWRLIGDSSSSRRIKVRINNVCVDNISGMLIIDLDESLTPGMRGQLDIGFEAQFKHLGGVYFHQSRAQSEMGQQINYFSSRLKVHSPSVAFPSFDEPAFMSVFEMSIVIGAEESAYSTMPVQSEHVIEPGMLFGFGQGDNDDDFYSHEKTGESSLISRSKSTISQAKIVRFKATPVMPNYLVGVISGKFRVVGHSSSSGMPIRLMMHSDRDRSQDRFVVRSAAAIVDELERQFGQPYPAPKLDIVAAIEHSSAFLGLTITRPKSLFSPEQGTEPSRQHKSMTILVLIRNIASSWLNMVLPRKWWNDALFHDAFPKWMAERYTSLIYPEHEQLLHQNDFTSIALMRNPEIYHDATSANNMHMTNDQMQRVVGIYANIDDFSPNLLVNHIGQLMRSRPNKLINLNQAFEGLPKFVRAYLFEWVRTKGYPVVTVAQFEPKVVTIQQDAAKQLEQDDAKRWQDETRTWPLLLKLLVYRADGNGPQTIPLVWTGNTNQIKVQLPDWFDRKQGHWYILKNGIGFHRVRYASEPLDILGYNFKQLTRMSPVDRKTMLLDSVGLVRIGSVDAIYLFRTIAMFMKEQDLFVIRSLADAVIFLKRLYAQGSPTQEAIDVMSKLIFGVWFERYKFTDKPDLVEGELASLANAYDLLVTSGHKPIIAASMELYRSGPDSWQRAPEHVRWPMLAAVARYGNEREYSNLLKIYRAQEGLPLRLPLLRALATAAPNLQRIELLIDTILEKPTDSPTDPDWVLLLHRAFERILKLGIELEPYMKHVERRDRRAHQRLWVMVGDEEPLFFPAHSNLRPDMPTNRLDIRRVKEANGFAVRLLNFGVEQKLVDLLNGMALAHGE